MTSPFPQLPNVELGNTATDIGSAVSSFAKGLQAERARRREEALANAMMQMQMMKLNQPDYRHIVSQTPEGPRHAFTDMKTLLTNVTDQAAADPQMMLPTQDANGSWNLSLAPRNDPNRAPQAPNLPPNQYPRQPAPIVVPGVETSQGPRTMAVGRTPNPAGSQPQPQQGLPSQAPVQAGLPQRQQPVQGQQPQGTVQQIPSGGLPTRATEGDEQRARGAFDMLQGRYEMKQALADAGQNAQNVYDEASRYIAALDIGKEIPLIGGALEAFIGSTQSALSPPAARYYVAFMHAAANKVFSQGGKTLTKMELNTSLVSLAPKPFQDPTTEAAQQRLWSGVIAGAMTGNNAWIRYRDYAKSAFGYDDSFEGTVQGLTQPPPAAPSINPLTGRPRRH